MGGFPLLNDALKKLRPTRYDDSVDRLHYLVTTYFLLFLAIVITGYEYAGTPVLCWVPAEFKDTWKQFVDSLCFVQNTYAIPFWKNNGTDRLYKLSPEVKLKASIGYYQWVPLVFACQALFFYFPNFIWQNFNWQSGLNLKAILSQAHKAVGLRAEERHKLLQSVADYIYDCLVLQRNKSALKWFHWGNRWGSFVSCLYFTIKVLYLVNVIGQLSLLYSFLGAQDQWWGFHLFQNLLAGRDWQQSQAFPRVTLCEYYAPAPHGHSTHTSQCVLKINVFNEKIFILLWFWFWILALVSIANILYWLVSLVPYFARFNFVCDNLVIGGTIQKSDRKSAKLHLFVTRLLRPDGILVIRFVNGHIGDLITTELLGFLWGRFGRDWNHMIREEPNNNTNRFRPRNLPVHSVVSCETERSSESSGLKLRRDGGELDMTSWRVLP